MNWALRWQRENGWFEKCCLSDNSQPLTHTIGYALRGIIEAYRYGGDASHLKAARRTADGLLTALTDDGFLSGRLDADWRGVVNWTCLTGSVQLASCWFLLYQDTGEVQYRDAAFAATKYVRRTVKIDGPPETRGAVKGSFPIYGRYRAYEYPNWACKFLVDANMLDLTVRRS